MEALESCGKGIDERFLRTVLSPTEYAYFHSPRAFAVGARTPRRRWPLVLAFGEQTTRLFALCAGEDSGVGPRSDLGAVFNLGISLFDYVLDTALFAATAQDVLLALERHGLHGLLDEEICEDFGDSLVRRPPSEARLLLRLIQQFHAGVLRLRPGPEALEELATLLQEAMTAEISSVQVAGPGWEPAAVGVAQAKSVLPFQVLAWLGRYSDSPRSPQVDDEAHRRLAKELGQAFALVDDLCDLVEDLQGRAINSLANRPIQTQGSDLETDAGLDADTATEALEAMLSSDQLDRAAADVVCHLKEVEQRVHDLVSRDHQGEAAELLATMRAFLRNWIE
jgi:hypothetical protein